MCYNISNMFTLLRKIILILAGAPILLTACGAMDTVLPSGGIYGVNALIGKFSLDECSIITEKDTVRPFFTNPVKNDPDITGLMVFLQSPGGEIAGGKVQYTIEVVDTGVVPDDGDKDRDGEDGEEETEEEENTGTEPEKQDGALTDTLIHVSRLDNTLPPFPLPENLDIGRYTLVFQVLGDKEVLDRINRPVYYIGDAEFILNDIQSYSPGISAGSHLIPPGLTIMLETRVIAGEGLDPYIVWYNGKKRIHEGAIAEGADRFLWQAPDQPGFHTLRAEVFPFSPGAGLRGNIRELSLPVSAKNEHTGTFAKKADQFTNWYQFAGDLRDSRASAEKDRVLTSQKDHPLRWLPAEGVYGLALGAGDTYQLPLTPFAHSEDERVEGQLLLRFKPVSGGTVFSALFTGDDPLLLDMSLAAGEDGMILGLHVGEESIEIPLSSGISTEQRGFFLESLKNEAFITAEINFSIDTDYFTAALILENSGGDALEPVSIPLSAPLSGEVSFRLGDSPTVTGKKNVSGSTGGEAQNSAPAVSSSATILPNRKIDEPAVIAIFDEFAAMYRLTPIIKEEITADPKKKSDLAVNSPTGSGEST
ncbi:hypothetical protein AGMMS50255_6030 [Spirochaetia bacterium]|nr:hypothetical protein AGMMS50255_6030 [Spirochaetia bacterium]